MAQDRPDLGIDLRQATGQVIEAVQRWQETFGAFDTSPAVVIDDASWRASLESFIDRLTGEQYPFFHPHYGGQMLKPPHPVAVVGYLAAMLINPNNHALDGGPATAAM